jgi:hypothetical protein
MVKLILFKKETCPTCIKFKELHNFNELKKKLELKAETKDIKIFEYETQEDIKGIEEEISTAYESKKIIDVPTLCLFYDSKNWEIIDIEVWIDQNNNKRNIDSIFNNIKTTLDNLKKKDNKNSIKNKYIKYKIKYLELKNKYLQQK